MVLYRNNLRLKSLARLVARAVYSPKLTDQEAGHGLLPKQDDIK